MSIEPACGRRSDLPRGKRLTSNIERRISNLIGGLVSVSITALKEFPIRVTWKSVVISPRAKPGSYARDRGNFAVVDQIFFGAPLSYLFSFSVRSGSSCAGSSAANGRSTSNTTMDGSPPFLPSIFFGSAGRTGQSRNELRLVQILRRHKDHPSKSPRF
jgi:hypothetical protein